MITWACLDRSLMLYICDQVAFGRWGRGFVSVIFYIQLLFEVTIFMVLLCQCLTLLLPHWSARSVTGLSTALLILLSNLFTSPNAATLLSVISCVSIVLMCATLLGVFVANLAMQVLTADSASDALLPPPIVIGVNDNVRYFFPDHLLAPGPSSSVHYVSSEGRYSFWSVLGDTELFTSAQNSMRALGIFR